MRQLLELARRVEDTESYRAARGAGWKDQRMEAAGDKARRQIWSEADVIIKPKYAAKRAQGTDDAGVNWASVSMELGRCIAHVKKKWGRLKLDSGKTSGAEPNLVATGTQQPKQQRPWLV